MVQNITATYDGQVLKPDWAIELKPNQKYILTIREVPSGQQEGSAWDVLKSLAGSIDAPEDWAEEHDHYLYGKPKGNSS